MVTNNSSTPHVLITRAASQASSFGQLLQARGLTVVEMPTLEIAPPSSWEPLDGAIAQLNRFHWLVLTSANAVTFFMERLREQGKTNADLQGLQLAVVGKKTAQVLLQFGLEPDFMPPSFIADALVEYFPEPLARQQILFPRVESGGRPVLVKAFEAHGARVVEVPAYESRCPSQIDPGARRALGEGQLDVITFASSKTVRHFAQLVAQSFGPDWGPLLENVAIASIGPQTSTACQQLLGRVDIEAQEYTLDGLTAAILEHFQLA